jgi:hypothetical protein
MVDNTEEFLGSNGRRGGNIQAKLSSMEILGKLNV